MHLKHVELFSTSGKNIFSKNIFSDLSSNTCSDQEATL